MVDTLYIYPHKKGRTFQHAFTQMMMSSKKPNSTPKELDEEQ